MRKGGGLPNIVFVDPAGDRLEVTARIGQTVLQLARAQGVGGLDAECGGNASCATCHVMVEAGQFDPPAMEESAMVDCVLDLRQNSRLACQLRIGAGADGAVIVIPARQK